jgi:small subunit ribosomal protein S20
MPNTSAAAKALRQNIKIRARNTAVKNNIKKLTVGLRKALTAKDAGQAKTVAQQLIRAYDKAGQKRIINRNSAARHKSRIVARLKTVA